MIPKGLFTQIAMVIVAVSIIFTYIRPSVNELGAVQDSIGIYQSERTSVSSVNGQLSSHMSRLESVSNTDQRKLLTYLPDSIDEIAVQRDLLLISNEAGVIYQSSEYLGDEDIKKGKQSQENNVNVPQPHTFTLSVVGTYTQLKNMFRLIEQNNYLLEVREVDISTIEGNLLSAEITFSAYVYQPPINSNQITF